MQPRNRNRTGKPAQYISWLALMALTGILPWVGAQVHASEAGVSGTWVGTIPCVGPSEIKSRTPVFRTDGDKAWLSDYGKGGETYESTLKKSKAKFKGEYKGVHNNVPFYKYIRATVKILDNGDAKVTGTRGRNVNCSGTLKKTD